MGHADVQKAGLVNPAILGEAIGFAFRRLSPRYQLRNPVMFVVYVCAIVTTWLAFSPDILQNESVGFVAAISVWLWITVVFANFAESLAEGRGMALEAGADD